MNHNKINETVLALLFLGRHQVSKLDDVRAWKGFDWDTLDRLHKKGLISNPIGKAKSVAFTKDGLDQAEQIFHKLFETIE